MTSYEIHTLVNMLVCNYRTSLTATFIKEGFVIPSIQGVRSRRFSDTGTGFNNLPVIRHPKLNKQDKWRTSDLMASLGYLSAMRQACCCWRTRERLNT